MPAMDRHLKGLAETRQPFELIVDQSPEWRDVQSGHPATGLAD